MAFSWSTALTIIGSFGAASTAQIVSHILTQKREDKKYKKECLQNLFSPTIFKVIEYIEIESKNYSSNPFLIHEEINTQPLFNEIIDSIGANLKYADADLINIYQEVRNSELQLEGELELPDGPDEADDTFNNRIKLLNVFISQYIDINKDLKSNSQSIIEKLSAPYFFTHFYLLISESCYLEFSSLYVLEVYDLVEGILLQINNFTERIIDIREELDIVMNSPAYKDANRVTDAYASAYEFLYELVNEFSCLSEDRANDWKELLDDWLPR